MAASKKPLNKNLPDLCLLAIISQMTARERINAHRTCPAWYHRVREVNRTVDYLSIAYKAYNGRSLVSNTLMTCFIDRTSSQGLKIIIQDTVGPANNGGNPWPLTEWNCLQYDAIGRDLNSQTIQQILATFSNLTKLVFVSYGYHDRYMISILKLFEPFATVKSVSGKQFQVDLVDGSNFISHISTFSKPFRESVFRLSKFSISNSSLWLPKVCTTFPNLKFLSLGFSVLMCPQLFPVLARLPHLAHLVLAIGFFNTEVEWPVFEYTTGHHLPSRLSSVKTFKLDIGISEHSQLRWVLRRLSMPALEEVSLERLYCQQCAVESNIPMGELRSETDMETARACIRASLQSIYANTGISLDRLSYKTEHYYGATKKLLFGM